MDRLRAQGCCFGRVIGGYSLVARERPEVAGRRRRCRAARDRDPSCFSNRSCTRRRRRRAACARDSGNANWLAHMSAGRPAFGESAHCPAHRASQFECCAQGPHASSKRPPSVPASSSSQCRRRHRAEAATTRAASELRCDAPADDPRR